MKRVFLSFLVFFLVINVFPETTFAANFSDVPESHLHFEAIRFLNERAVISGYSEGNFQPENDVNRAELLKMVMASSHKEELQNPSQTNAAGSTFTDLESNAWYMPFLEIALKNGIVSGYEDKTFRPAQTVNFAEALKIILLGFGIKGEELLAETDAFSDLSPDDWFFSFASYSWQKRLIEPQDDGLLHPERQMTRGEIAEIVYRLIFIRENHLDSFDISLNWPTLTRDSQYFSLKYPQDWKVYTTEKGSVLWKKMPEQPSPERLYRNAARITIFLDDNEEKLSSAEYFDAVRSNALNFPKVQIKDFIWNNVYPALRIEYETQNEHVNDWYLFLPNGKALIFYGTLSLGPALSFLEEKLIAVEHTFTYIENNQEKKENNQKVLEDARKNIFVDGAGEKTLALFPDKELIETDAIGIGTGPVDYYYSAIHDVTLKYERSFDVILGIKEGKITSF
ncbi:S-layer homology domain-containing protein [Candidatus Peregrinibacteria bacterium]|nr:S-layer homology domain-containing protein [Candidatus Peregrinibacteria bacterium]